MSLLLEIVEGDGFRDESPRLETIRPMVGRQAGFLFEPTYKNGRIRQLVPYRRQEQGAPLSIGDHQSVYVWSQLRHEFLFGFKY